MYSFIVLQHSLRFTWIALSRLSGALSHRLSPSAHSQLCAAVEHAHHKDGAALPQRFCASDSAHDTRTDRALCE